MDQLSDFLSDLPIGLIVFAIAMLFGVFGKDDKKKQPRPEAREVARQEPSAFGEQRRPGTAFASDERRARHERAMQEQRSEEDVIVFGGLEFGSGGSLFRDGEGRREDSGTQWGKTKYGFDESEWGSASQWGSTFAEKKSSEPVIR